MSSSTYVVVHPKINMLIAGKTIKLAVGHQVDLNPKQVERLGGKVKPLKSVGKTDLAREESEARAKAKAEAEALAKKSK